MSRNDRIAEAIKKEISLIIHDELKDPRLGFITITGAEVSQDYRNVKIYYSVLGKEEDHKKTQDAFDSALGYIRKLISERINLKFAPEIILREDRSCEYSVRIEEVLSEINELNPSRPSGETGPGTKKRKEDLGEPKKSNRRNKKSQ